MHQKEFISVKVQAAWHFLPVYFSVTMAALTLLWLGYLSFAQEQRGLVVSPKSTASAWGNYWALIVGIDQYQEWPPLETAVNDARGLKALLKSQYGFPPLATPVDSSAWGAPLIAPEGIVGILQNENTGLIWGDALRILKLKNLPKSERPALSSRR